MDLSAFKDIDPDEIYHNSDYKITFFYLPEKDELIYSKEGYKTHEDMLQVDDDKNDHVFNAVFPGVPNNQKNGLRSRGKVLAHTDRIVGRFGALHNDIVVALWNNLNHPAIEKFKQKFLKTFPNLRKADVILVGKDKNPQLMNSADEFSASKKKVNDSLPNKEDEEKIHQKYNIDGNDYTFDELKNLRLLTHTTAGTAKNQAYSVLCHPDMKKYDGINSLIPGNCPNSRSFSRRPRLKDYGIAGYYGESFRDFYNRKMNEQRQIKHSKF